MMVMPHLIGYVTTTDELLECCVYIDKMMYQLAVRCLHTTMYIAIVACYMNYTRLNLRNDWYIHFLFSELLLMWAVLVTSMCMVGCAALSFRITYYMRYSDEVSDLIDAMQKSIGAKEDVETLYNHANNVLTWCIHVHIVIQLYIPIKRGFIAYTNGIVYSS